MARRNTLKSLAEGMQMPLLTIEEIKMYRYMKDAEVVKSIAKVHLPTKYGEFEMEAFDTGDGQEPALLLTKGNLSEVQPLLLRIHSECLTGDIFGSKRCDCGEQLERSLKEIQSRGRGALLYLRQEGRGIGLANKLKAYELQEQGMDTVEANLKLGFQADERHYGVAAAILRKKGVTKVNLLTNNPDKIKQLETLGIKVEERVTIQIPARPENRSYLKVKKEKMHHLLKGMD
jgi:3,4-dihydroxy 2-butanone 4-phosphate synthase/GTP cyclohydrolase II